MFPVSENCLQQSVVSWEYQLLPCYGSKPDVLGYIAVGCRFVPYTFSETIRHGWYQAGSSARILFRENFIATIPRDRLGVVFCKGRFPPRCSQKKVDLGIVHY